MFVIFGKRFYGSIDGVEGLGSVRTLFFHLFWIPVIPMQSMVGGHEMNGLHWRSVLAAYVRAFLFAGFALPAYSLYEIYDHSGHSSNSMTINVLACLVFSTLLILSYVFTRRAPPERALEIIKRTALPSAAMYVQALYGMIPFDEAERAAASEKRAREQAQHPGTNNPW